MILAEMKRWNTVDARGSELLELVHVGLLFFPLECKDLSFSKETACSI